MTREEAIKYLIKPVATSTAIGEEKQKEFEAYNMAIEALSAEALQVVYCKDCKHKYEPSCQIVTSMYGLKDYDYCSYGEKE